jgi:hypothetical protein
MCRGLLAFVIVGALVGACQSAAPSAAPVVTTGPTATPVITPAPTPTAAPTASPTAAPSAGRFTGLPFSLDLPVEWQTFDLSNPGSKAALDEFTKNNPTFAGAIAAFSSMPNVRMAVNPLLGNVVIAVGIPTGGLPIDTIGASLTAQFAAVPGMDKTPKAESVTLPSGPGLHWDLVVKASDGSGGAISAEESIYLVASTTDAVLVEFVAVGNGTIPQEQQIIDSLRFQP